MAPSYLQAFLGLHILEHVAAIHILHSNCKILRCEESLQQPMTSIDNNR